MAELKTQKNDASVDEFLNRIPDEKKRAESFRIRDLMARITGEPGTMWGDTIVGFGSYDYRYASGRSGTWFTTGFSPRKQNLTLYIISGFDRYEDLLGRLGKHSLGKSCLYVNKLEDIDMDVLEELVRASVDHLAAANKS